jgi:tetratricopeptide (TPR) repeat protein
MPAPAAGVRIWAERTTIPTYAVGVAERNPMFLEKRVYQGSSGAVYPHPVIDKVTDTRTDREYTAVHLENRYLRIMVLPELGGRVQMALDKTNGHHFVYYNRVIKPALVGLAGPWISGGIEFNWPQHHRPSTFQPLDWWIEERQPDAVTLWCGEIERMSRIKGAHGLRLYRDRAYLEIDVRIANRTSEPQTFLWWANPAVSAHDAQQSVFPPDVYAVFDHGKRDVSSFPIATGTYYNVDYSPGTDISRYVNIPVPTSYMAHRSDFDFIGSFDHRARAGMLHVANHHVAPGKKQWTWGDGDFGRAWDRQLTDEDGPYVELMCGAYTDNQPDFSWLHPGEEKRFRQVFMPYKDIGLVKNASSAAAVNLEVAGGRARVGVYVTERRDVRVRLLVRGRPVAEVDAELSPETTLVEALELPDTAAPQDVTIEVVDRRDPDLVLVAYTPLPDDRPALPGPATAPRLPQDIASSDELFLQGLHLEQYRHATCAPEPYYLEALRRDPGDARCNNAMGLLLLRRAKLVEAEAYFRAAIARLTTRNPNPYDGEPLHHLGVSLMLQGRRPEAADAFYKATWNAAWAAPSYFELARLASYAGRLEEGLALAEECLACNPRHHKARHLVIALLRQVGREAAALDTVDDSLALDPLELGARWEHSLLRGGGFEVVVADARNTFVELALDYLHAGLFGDAVKVLHAIPEPDPLVAYTLGRAHLLQGDPAAATDDFGMARELRSDYCFPNRVEDALALEAATHHDPGDPRAPYYLGLFYYAHRRYEEAIANWERARELDPSFATVHRNLGLAYFNKRSDALEALQSLERAFACNPTDARVLFELDQLEKRMNRPPTARLRRLEQHPALVEARDDLTIERITLCNLLRQPERAAALLAARTFHPWEGGEGKVTSQYVISLVELARDALQGGEPHRALELLEQARSYPPNLGEGKLQGGRQNDVHYDLGRAYAALGRHEDARHHFELATLGAGEPTSAVYYYDQPPEMLYYRALALRALSRDEEAGAIFNALVTYGRDHLADEPSVDYFAVSLPDFLVFEDDLALRNRVHCHYMMGLGHLGLGDAAAARRHLRRVLALDANHLGATRCLARLGDEHPAADEGGEHDTPRQP